MNYLITSSAPAVSVARLFGADGRPLQLVGEATPLSPAPALLSQALAIKVSREVKPKPDRKYVRLDKLQTFGKVPRQQADLAAILAESMDVGVEWTEAEVFELIKDSVKEYDSLRNSRMHATYLFAYYRGLKNDGTHAGFIARGFLRQVN